MFFNKKLKSPALIPRHIAFIMDGNGRWARRRGLPREMGHASGAETLVKLIDHCEEAGIEVMTVYAFSTENWSRPAGEVDALMKLIDKYLDYCMEKIASRNAIIRFIGDKSLFSQKLQDKMTALETRPRENRKLQLNVALNYGARAELVRAFNSLKQSADEITEQDISNALYTRAQPDPDLLVRTGGDIRISNFLLWQLSYSELYFTKTLWPDFDKSELYKALDAFAGRKRRYGNVEDKKGSR